MMGKKIHFFSYDHYKKFPVDANERSNATICGFVREKITTNVDEVTCTLCLRELENKKILKL